MAKVKTLAVAVPAVIQFRTTKDIIGKRFEDFEVVVAAEAITIEGSGAGEQISFDVATPQESASELREIAAWLDTVPVLKAQPGERLLYDLPEVSDSSEKAAT